MEARNITRHDIHVRYQRLLRMWKANADTAAGGLQACTEFECEPHIIEEWKRLKAHAEGKYSEISRAYAEFCKQTPQRGEVL